MERKDRVGPTLTPPVIPRILISDGIPRLFTSDGPECTEMGSRGQAGGASYVTNDGREHAIAMSPLGTSRVHPSRPITDRWMD